MENVVSLEQLDLRDQLIKEYIDARTKGGGGGSSNYMSVRLYTTKKYEDEDQSGRRLYLGLPVGTDPSTLSLKYLRKSRYSERDKANEDHFRCTGFHEVWYPPYNDGETRFDPLIKLSLSENIIFSKQDYDYYEVLGLVDGVPYHMNRYINMSTDEFPTGYLAYDESTGENQPVSISMILSHKVGGLVIMKDGVAISNFARFCATSAGDTTYSISIFNNYV